MSNVSNSEKPRPTSGHHFSALLICPRRAWHEYFSNKSDKAPDPPHLVAAQRDGLRHEKQVYKEEFANAVRIPERVKKEKRIRLTREALKQGKKYVLQAYLSHGPREGIADVLERVASSEESSLGHIYRVGEIKSAKTLRTAHVLQTAWYTDILSQWQSLRVPDTFFILGDRRRHEVRLHNTEAVFDDCERRLDRIREGRIKPNPRLNRSCAACPWRSFCMPELVGKKDLSLAPHIGPLRARSMESEGVSTWADLRRLNDHEWPDLSLNEWEKRMIRKGLESLAAGRCVLSTSLKKEVFRNFRPITANIERAEDRWSQPASPRPDYLIVGKPPDCEKISISYDADGKPEGDLKSISECDGLVSYGALDTEFIRRMLKAGGARKKKTIDLLDVVRRFVHCPLPGLRLGSVAAFATDEPDPTILSGPEERVDAINDVVEWISPESGRLLW